jgi:DNA polymerase-3 subunit delta
MTPATTPTATATPATAYLVSGGDEVLVRDAARDLVHELVGEADASLVVEDFGDDDYDLAAVVDAARTLPFLTDHRVVVARGMGRFRADDVAPLLAYLADPSPTTALVLVAGGGTTPPALASAVKKAGQVVDTGVPWGRGRERWLAERLKEAPVRLDGEAAARLAEHLGEEVARLPAIVETLEAAYGHGARIGVEELEPFLGEAGETAPWDLTDALDRGDTETALGHLHRMLGAGRHPLAVLATLHTHYARLLRLDGADAADETAAAAMLGMKGSTFPAKKALTQARRLGSERIGRAIVLLADADLDLKGVREWPDVLVLEVLVARLSRLAPREREPARSSRRR